MSVAATAVRPSVFAALQSRIDSYRAAGGELIPLQIGDTCLPPPPSALAASRAVAAREISVYGAVPGMPELREALARRLAQRGLAGVDSASNVHVGCGCTHALFCAARAVLDPGDEVLVLTPYWPLIVGLLQTCGAVPIEVPLTQALYRDPRIDIEALLDRASSRKTRALYAVSPNNPDGHVLDRHQLQALSAFALRRDLWVFADEVYWDFAYEREHMPLANLPNMAARTITCHSLSKSHALAGARIGFVAAAAEVIDATRCISNHTIYNVPVAMQRAALAALGDGEGFVTRAREQYLRARDRVCRALSAHGIRHHVPMGGGFVFVDLGPALGKKPLQRLLELAIDRGVLLAPGDAFGRDHGSCARLCFTGVEIEHVLSGVQRLAEAIDVLAAEAS